VDALTLASEGIKNRDLWYPTIVGVLVVVAAVGLFCGSVYLLLATNLGSRLGFLVAAAGLSGLMMLLACLWLTTGSPLNTLKGRIPQWRAVESIENGDVAQSKIGPVQTIRDTGRKVDVTEQANVKAAVDQALVATTEGGAEGSQQTASANKFAVYQSATDYLVNDTFETGGGNIFSQVDVSTGGGFPWIHVSLHKPRYAVVDICPADKDAIVVPFGESPPEPKCDASKPHSALVFERDLGSVRVPPFVALVASAIVFGLSLLGLHWRERDLQEKEAALAAAAEQAAAGGAAPGDAGAVDKTPEKV
jgi:hypothetical protein